MTAPVTPQQDDPWAAYRKKHGVVAPASPQEDFAAYKAKHSQSGYDEPWRKLEQPNVNVPGADREAYLASGGWLGSGKTFKETMQQPFSPVGALKGVGKYLGASAQGAAAGVSMSLSNKLVPDSWSMKQTTPSGDSPYENARDAAEFFPGPFGLVGLGLGKFGYLKKLGSVVDKATEGFGGGMKNVPVSGIAGEIAGPDAVTMTKNAVEGVKKGKTALDNAVSTALRHTGGPLGAYEGYKQHGIPGAILGYGLGGVAGRFLGGLARNSVPVAMGEASAGTKAAEDFALKMKQGFKVAGQEAKQAGSTLAMEPGLRKISEQAAKEAAEAAKWQARMGKGEPVLGMPPPRTATPQPPEGSTGASQLERELSRSLRKPPAAPEAAPPEVAPPAAPDPEALAAAEWQRKIAEQSARAGKPPVPPAGGAAGLGASLALGSQGGPSQPPGMQMPPSMGAGFGAPPVAPPLSSNVQEAKGKALQAVASGMVPMANLRDLLARTYEPHTVEFIMAAIPNRLPQ